MDVSTEGGGVLAPRLGGRQGKMDNPDLHVVDAQMKAACYAGMSRHYATYGHGWLAVHAQVAADLAAAQAAVLTSATSTPWVGAAVASTLAQTALEGLTARDVAREARAAIAQHLSDEAYDSWSTLTSSLEHLDAGLDISPETFTGEIQSRFEGLSPEDYIALRRAEGLSEVPPGGDLAQLISDQYDADMAAYEAWLLRRSLERGDTHLTQYELLWSLGTAAVSDLGTLPSDPVLSRRRVLSRLFWAIGPDEGENFLTELRGIEA